MATGATTADGAPRQAPRKATAASTRDTVHGAAGPGAAAAPDAALTIAAAAPPSARGTAGGRGGRAPKPKPVPATLILFVRHGTTPTTGQVLPGRAAGLHLADRGRAEADAVAERIAVLTAPPEPPPESPPAAPTNGAAARGRARPTPASAPPPPAVAAVYASPLERARETAAPIGKRLGLKVTVERGLIEMDFGQWTGAELKALRKLPEWETIQRYPSGFQFPGGEGFSAMRSRMAAAVANLCRRHPGETIVCVSHADTIKAVVNDALGSHLDLFQRIVVSPCSVTAISYSPTGPIVLAVNSTGSLASLRPS